MDERLLREFLAEAGDLVEGLYGDIAELRERRGNGPARRELVASVFRRVHTVKGTAAAAGLDAAGRIAHELESLLDAVRSGAAPLEEETLGVFEEAVGAIAESLEDAARGVARPVPEELVALLRRLATSGAPAHAGPAASMPELPGEVERALSAHERRRLSEALGEGARAYVVLAEFDLADFDEQYRRLSESLKESGEVVATQPFVNAAGPDRIGFRIVYASAEAREILEGRAAAFGATLDAALDERDADEGGQVGDFTHDAELSGVAETTPAQSSSAAARPTGVRMTLEELDDLISATHAVFADTVGALDLALAQGSPGAGRAELEARAREVRRRFFELEERLIGLRMVTLRTQLLRARACGAGGCARGGQARRVRGRGRRRAPRTLARRGGRRPSAPPACATRSITASKQRRIGARRASPRPGASSSRPTRRVDSSCCASPTTGAALTRKRSRARPPRRGLIAPGAHVTQAQALRLIFRPGFSTAERATLVSGRGVGLDVVERAVEEAGGEVRVRSEQGHGTTFELRLPTTLALLPAHVVRAGGRRYCVGVGQVVEAGHAELDAVVVEGGRRRLRWRGRELPLFGMSELLGGDAARETPQANGRVAFLVAGARQVAPGGEGARVAVAVDGLEGESEVLVRGLGRHANHWHGLGGATELRDGTVALVLDLPRLLEGLD